MKLSKVALLLLVVGLMSSGQILFKRAARDLPYGPVLSWLTLKYLFTNASLVGGVLLYGLTTLLWVYILRQVPLSLAYPFIALSIVLVPAAGVILFDEPFTWTLVLAGTLIVAGLIVLSLDV